MKKLDPSIPQGGRASAHSSELERTDTPLLPESQPTPAPTAPPAPSSAHVQTQAAGQVQQAGQSLHNLVAARPGETSVPGTRSGDSSAAEAHREAAAAFARAQNIPRDPEHHAERVKSLRDCVVSFVSCSDETRASAAFLELENCYGEQGSTASTEHLQILTALHQRLRASAGTGNCDSLSGRVAVRAEHQARILAEALNERPIQENSDWIRRALNPLVALVAEPGGVTQSRVYQEEEARIHAQQARLAPPRNLQEQAERLLAVNRYYQSVSPNLGDPRVQEVLNRDHPERLPILHHGNEQLYLLAAELRRELQQHPEASAARLHTAALLVAIDEHLSRTPYLGGDSRVPAGTSFIQEKISQGEGNTVVRDLTQLRGELLAAQNTGRAEAYETQQALGEYLSSVSECTAALNILGEATDDQARTLARANILVTAAELRPLQDFHPLQALREAWFQQSIQELIRQQDTHSQSELQSLAPRMLEDLRSAFNGALERGDASWMAAHVEHIENPLREGVLQGSVSEAFMAHRFLAAAETANPHHNHRQLSERELELRMNAAERFSRSDLYLGNRVSEALAPVEAYAQFSSPSRALAWVRLLTQSASLLLRTRRPESPQHTTPAHRGIAADLQHANDILGRIPGLEATARGLNAAETLELHQMAEVVPGLQAWNCGHLLEAQHLLEALGENPRAREALEQIGTERRMGRCGPLSMVLRAVLRNAYENRIQNTAAYGDNYVESCTQQVDGFIGLTEQLFASGHPATYEGAMQRALHEPQFAHDPVLQDFFHSPLEVAERVRRFIHEASDMGLDEARIRAMSLDLAHDMGEISTGYMNDVWGSVRNAPGAFWECLSGRNGHTTGDFLHYYNRLGHRTHENVVLSTALSPFRFALTSLLLPPRLLMSVVLSGAGMLDFAKSISLSHSPGEILASTWQEWQACGADWRALAHNGFDHFGASRSGLSSDYQDAERYLLAAQEIAQDYSSDVLLGGRAGRVLGELSHDEGLYRIGIALDCTSRSGARNAVIMAAASLSGVGALMLVKNMGLGLTALQAALVSGVANGLYQTCAQSVQQAGNWRRDENLTRQFYAFVSQMGESALTGAFSAGAGTLFGRLGFLLKQQSFLGRAGALGARELTPVAEFFFRRAEFWLGEVASEMVMDRVNEEVVLQFKRAVDLPWLLCSRQIDRIHGFQGAAGVDTPLWADVIENAIGELSPWGHAFNFLSGRVSARIHEIDMHRHYARSLQQMGFTATEVRQAYRMDDHFSFIDESRSLEQAQEQAGPALREAMAFLDRHEAEGGHPEDLETQIPEDLVAQTRQAAYTLRTDLAEADRRAFADSAEGQALGLRILFHAISNSTSTRRMSLEESTEQITQAIGEFNHSGGFSNEQVRLLHTQVMEQLLKLDPEAREHFIYNSRGLAERLNALVHRVQQEPQQETAHAEARTALLQNFFARLLVPETLSTRPLAAYLPNRLADPTRRNLIRLERQVASRLKAIDRVLSTQSWTARASNNQRAEIRRHCLERALDQGLLARAFHRELKQLLRKAHETCVQLFIPFSGPLPAKERSTPYRSADLVPSEAAFFVWVQQNARGQTEDFLTAFQR
ncbi:MAG: hypothetical protein HQM15_11650, partial [Deltaproteobacteria bacterium]|nr:hypothetical protein [Deltaproteobacteria bacterium]